MQNICGSGNHEAKKVEGGMEKKKNEKRKKKYIFLFNNLKDYF